MPIKIIRKRNIIFFVCIICFFGCAQQEKEYTPESAANLRKRVNDTYAYFLNFEHSKFIEMHTLGRQKIMFESNEEKEKTLEEWEGFVKREKPTFLLENLKIVGKKATIKMKGSILDEKGNRRFSEFYDLWIFENGNWFLSDSLKISPEYLRET